MSELQARIDRSTAWVAAASVVLGILDLVSTVICLRLWVSTEEFGTATLAIALFPILDRLGGLGLTTAAVREDSTSSDVLSSVFWLALGVSSALVVALVSARPVIGAWFVHPVVASLLVAYAVRLVIMSAGVVPEALLKRALRFRELSIVRVIASLAETATRLGLAYLGAHGVPELRIWCFALGPVANTVVTTIGVQLCEPWWPRWVIRRAVVARVARFTAAVSGGELLYYAYTSADYLVIGAWFGAAAVGAYRLAYELVLDVVRLLSMITAEVAFPAFVRLAGDRRAVGQQLLRFTRQNLVIVGPFLIFVAIEADDLLALLYRPLPEAAAAARILCVVGALRTLGFIMLPMLVGVGHARRVLGYNALAAIVLPGAFWIAAASADGSGMRAVAWAWALGYPVAFAALLAMTLPPAGLRLREYVAALARVAACAALAGVAGIAIRAVGAGGWRVGEVAVAVLAAYVIALAAIARITPASIARSLREPSAA